MILFITGGARSGKSTAAVEAARHCGRAVVFVATATAGDDEMVGRIACHQNERPDEWTTVEALDLRLDAVVAAASGRPGPTIVVSNEVGSGIVPDNLLGRTFRDLLGRANQRFAAVADRAVLSVSGRLVELGPASETLRV